MIYSAKPPQQPVTYNYNQPTMPAAPVPPPQQNYNQYDNSTYRLVNIRAVIKLSYHSVPHLPM